MHVAADEGQLSSKKGREAEGRERGHQPSGLVSSGEKQHLSQQNREEQSITIQLRCVCMCMCVTGALAFAVCLHCIYTAAVWYVNDM